MTRRTKRGRFWCEYIRQLADLMGLRDWSVMVMNKPTGKRAGAAVRCTYGRKIVEIKLAPNFNAIAPELQRHYLVHELVHVHLWGVTQAVADVRMHTPKRWVQHLELAIGTAQEYGVDALAEVIAPTMPLPGGKTGEGAHHG